MVYEELIEASDKNLKRIRLTIALMLTLGAITVLYQSFFVGLLLLVYCGAMFIFASGAPKENVGKGASFEGEKILFRVNLSINLIQIRDHFSILWITIIGVLYYLDFIIGKYPLYITLILSIMILGCTLVLFWSVKQLYDKDKTVFETGIYSRKGAFLYSDIKRYQFIAMKSGGYLCDINLGSRFVRIKVSEEDRDSLEKLFTDGKCD